jgi:hypothetical protein
MPVVYEIWPAPYMEPTFISAQHLD